jgi:hypothetical protein
VRKRVKCFDEALERGVSYTVLDAGLRVVEIRSITGTVDKCGELDEHFRYTKRRDRNESNRMYRIIQAFKQNTFFPPVELNLYKGEYYVVDGNRRVSAAIEMGMSYIDAHVTEYINADSPLEMSGAYYRRRFEQQTGIRNILLTYENGFEVLRREVDCYAEADASPTGWGSWYSQVYLPRCKKIEKSILPAHYSNVRTGDLYVLIAEFFHKFTGGIPPHVDYDIVISGFLFAHGLSPRRGLKSHIYRLLAHVLFRDIKSI